MSVKGLVDSLAKELEVKKGEAKRVLGVLVDVIVQGLVSEGEVRIEELGTFRIREKVKPVRDVRRGISLGKRKFRSVSFKPVKSFKDLVTGAIVQLDLEKEKPSEEGVQ